MVKDYPFPPPSHIQEKKFWIITCTTIWGCYHFFVFFFVFFCLFTHLRISRSPPKFNQYFIVLPKPLHKISSQSVHNFLSNVVHRQTNRQTNATKNITSFVKEIKKNPVQYNHFPIAKTQSSMGCKQSVYVCYQGMAQVSGL